MVVRAVAVEVEVDEGVVMVVEVWVVDEEGR